MKKDFKRSFFPFIQKNKKTQKMPILLDFSYYSVKIFIKKKEEWYYNHSPLFKVLTIINV